MKKKSEVQRGFNSVGAYIVWTTQTRTDKKQLWMYVGHLGHNSKWSAISILEILKWDLGLIIPPKDMHLNTGF